MAINTNTFICFCMFSRNKKTWFDAKKKKKNFKKVYGRILTILKNILKYYRFIIFYFKLKNYTRFEIVWVGGLNSVRIVNYFTGYFYRLWRTLKKSSVMEIKIGSVRTTVGLHVWRNFILRRVLCSIGLFPGNKL